MAADSVRSPELPLQLQPGSYDRDTGENQEAQSEDRQSRRNEERKSSYPGKESADQLDPFSPSHFCRSHAI